MIFDIMPDHTDGLYMMTCGNDSYVILSLRKSKTYWIFEVNM